MSAKAKTIKDLLAIMERLRCPEDGCPWDLKQTYQTIAPYTIEEAYEVIDAIERNDMCNLKDELGDLLFQIVFYAQMAKEDKQFDFADIVSAICKKMVRRHPHVFGNDPARSDEDIALMWERVKRSEHAQAKGNKGDISFFEGLTPTLPELQYATKLQKKAAQVGFDWPSVSFVLDKLDEEVLEVKDALAQYDRTDIQDDFVHLEQEIGDLLFVIVNLARHRNIKPEMALRQANEKFKNRFNYIEKKLRKMGVSLDEASLEEMDALWDEAKTIQTGKL